MPKSAVDVIGPAFEHTRRQIAEPFNFGQWARLAVLTLATGEMSSGGGCNSTLRGLSGLPSHIPGTSQNFVDPGDLLRSIDPAILFPLIAVAVIGGIVLVLVWIYVASVSRFILFESIVRKHVELGAGWDRWHRQGVRYFGFQLGLVFVNLAMAAVLLLPLVLALVAAMKRNGHFDSSSLLAFLPVLFLFGVFSLFMLLVAVLTKDFVVPVMATEHTGVIDGWRRLLALMKVEKWKFAGYVGMKIVLTIGASVVFGILSGIVTAIVVLPLAVAGVVIFLVARGGGFSFNVFTITAAIVLGVILLAGVLYLVALVCVPVAVFFPAYAMYFLAERLPALHVLLYPPAPASTPPPHPPSLPPTPQPIG